MSAARKVASCFLVLFLGIIAVLIVIALAWGAVLLIQRGAGVGLPDHDAPAVQEHQMNE